MLRKIQANADNYMLFSNPVVDSYVTNSCTLHPNLLKNYINAVFYTVGEVMYMTLFIHECTFMYNADWVVKNDKGFITHTILAKNIIFNRDKYDIVFPKSGFIYFEPIQFPNIMSPWSRTFVLNIDKGEFYVSTDDFKPEEYNDSMYYGHATGVVSVTPFRLKKKFKTNTPKTYKFINIYKFGGNYSKITNIDSDYMSYPLNNNINYLRKEVA